MHLLFPSAPKGGIRVHEYIVRVQTKQGRGIHLIGAAAHFGGSADGTSQCQPSSTFPSVDYGLLRAQPTSLIQEGNARRWVNTPAPLRLQSVQGQVAPFCALVTLSLMAISKHRHGVSPYNILHPFSGLSSTDEIFFCLIRFKSAFLAPLSLSSTPTFSFFSFFSCYLHPVQQGYFS